jgi:hypothetical protein
MPRATAVDGGPGGGATIECAGRQLRRQRRRLLTAELGVGEAARLLVVALGVAQVPLLPVALPTPPPARDRHPYAVVPPTSAGYPVNVVAINGRGRQRFHDDVGMAYFENRHNIGVWWWEVEAFPPEWRAAFDLLDEL